MSTATAVADASSEGGPALEVADLSLRFGGITALDSVSFSAQPGELLAVLGPNGAGKSSLFNCINGVYKPSAGRVLLNGQDISRLPPHRRARVGLARTFQNLALFDEMTVLQNLMAGRSRLMRSSLVTSMTWFGPARRQELEHREPVERVIEFLELGRHRHDKVASLSYGWRKRVELARALCMDPEVLLLDEPLAGINDAETRETVGHLLEVRERLGITMVLVEHNLGVVLDIADRVLVLDFGKVIALGPPDEIVDDPAVVAAYVGEKRAKV
jgi:branched-chain amino acid transport system ATP-binding protein